MRFGEQTDVPWDGMIPGSYVVVVIRSRGSGNAWGVMVPMDREPEGYSSSSARASAPTTAGVASDLERFKEMIESQGSETGAWRGEVEYDVSNAADDRAGGLRLGYACVNTQLPSAARTLRLANVTPERLRELIAANLDALEGILRWNAAQAVRVFRLTSNLIPFASHSANELVWWEEFADPLAKLGSLLRSNDVSVSTHPGQYTVLSSAQPHVVAAAVAELEYHARLLEALGLDESAKIVLHVGSGAADPAEARRRFAAGFFVLSAGARARLTLENDERWPLDSVLELAAPLGIPVVFDAFHHELAPSRDELTVLEATLAARATWRPEDGRQEVHFSTQEPGKRPGAHAETIDDQAFLAFSGAVGDLPLDCILEVKDKERSVLRARELLGASV